MEADLIRKAKAGDIDALNSLVNKHKELAFNVALRIVQNVQDAQDVTQNSFLKALENLSRFREESSFSTWLYRIVYNEAMMLVRKRKKKKESPEATLADHNFEEERVADKAAMQQELNKAIEKLDAKERNVIDLFYLGEKSIKEIHQITGLSRSNVKVVLHRARVKLKKTINNG